MEFREVFTSPLTIKCEDYKFEKHLLDKSWSVESYIKGNFSFFDDSRVRGGERIFPESLDEYYRKKIQEYSDEYCDGILDLTSCLKGEFLYRLLEDEEIYKNRFLINFGGDMVGRGEYQIRIENSFSEVCTHHMFAIFTSGNDKRRGEHIKCKVLRNGTVTELFWNMDGNDISRLGDYDCYTTLRYAGMTEVCECTQEIWVENGISKIMI